MRELPEPKITPVLLDEFKQALAGGRGDLDAWLEVNDEAEVRAFVLAIQKQAYEDGLRDAAEMVRNAVTVLRLPEAATYISDDRPTVRSAALGIADAIEAMLTDSKKEPQ